MSQNPGRAAATPSVSAPPVDSRRENRLHVAVPVKVFMSPENPTFQLCCTYEISLIGARLVTVAGIKEVGQFIWIQRHNKRARYRVIWIGQRNTTQAEQVGVETMEPANVIWENELKQRIMQGK